MNKKVFEEKIQPLLQYIGAIGAKKYGALGSLVGMGLGVIAGAGTSKWIQKQFKSEN